MQVSVYQIMSNLGFINHLYGYIIMSMGYGCYLYLHLHPVHGEYFGIVG